MEEKPEQEIGIITHFFDHLSVAVIKIVQGAVKEGDTIHIKGHLTDFEQEIESMQIEHKPVKEAKAGQEIGIKVADKVREHDKVFKVPE